MSKTEMKNYAVRNWGMEDVNTIELFRMAERGESAEIMQEYIKLIDGARENEWFGFED